MVHWCLEQIGRVAEHDRVVSVPVEVPPGAGSPPAPAVVMVHLQLMPAHKYLREEPAAASGIVVTTPV